MMSKVFVYEFLYRGNVNSKVDDNTWHVILAREVTDISGNVSLEQTQALSPAKAAELGFDLRDVLSEINSEALNNVQRAQDIHAKYAELLQPREPDEERREIIVEPAKKKTILSKLSMGLFK